MMTQEESMMHRTGQKPFISSRDKELNMSPIVEEKIKNYVAILQNGANAIKQRIGDFQL